MGREWAGKGRGRMQMERTRIEGLWNQDVFYLFRDFAWNEPGFESSVSDPQNRLGKFL